MKKQSPKRVSLRNIICFGCKGTFDGFATRQIYHCQHMRLCHDCLHNGGLPNLCVVCLAEENGTPCYASDGKRVASPNVKLKHMWPDYFVPINTLECRESLFKVPEPRQKQPTIEETLVAAANEIERQWLCIIFAFKSKGDRNHCTILTKVRDETVLKLIKDDLRRLKFEMTMEDSFVTVSW